MIESLMLCGIGGLTGCLLMLMFVPLVHQRAVRLTKQQIVDATPLMVNEIQADKDRLRAEFAMSVRRLEISLEEMRTKAASRCGDIHKQNAEISRLQLELDRKTALIFALRTREEVRKGAVRRVLKILLYFYMRARRLRPPAIEPAQEVIQQHSAEVSRLQLELDKRMAAIFALRAREQVRKSIIRRALKIVLYFYIRTSRRRRPLPFARPLGENSKRPLTGAPSLKIRSFKSRGYADRSTEANPLVQEKKVALITQAPSARKPAMAARQLVREKIIGPFGRYPEIKRPIAKPTPKAITAVETELAKVGKAWQKYRSTNHRDAVYIYLEAVYALVRRWQRLNCALKNSQAALRLQADAPQMEPEPFGIVIFCTADPEIADSKTRSKWSRVLRLARKAKSANQRLSDFIKSNGGINACARMFARNR